MAARADAPAKVTDVFKSRDVNVFKNNLVTKSPLTFSNKLERAQTSKISTFFTVNSKTTSDSISQIDNFACSGQISSAAAKPDSHFANGRQPGSASLDASLGFPEDTWDDFDDFEIPVKGKNVLLTSEKCKMSPEPVRSPREEKSPCTGKGVSEGSVPAPEKILCRKEQSCAESGVLEHSVQDVAAVSPGPEPDQEDCLLGDSPVRPSRRRRNVLKKSVLCDSDEDHADEPCNEAQGEFFTTLSIVSEATRAHPCFSHHVVYFF